jgi:hypothetical protein
MVKQRMVSLIMTIRCFCSLAASLLRGMQNLPGRIAVIQDGL